MFDFVWMRCNRGSGSCNNVGVVIYKELVNDLGFDRMFLFSGSILIKSYF